MATKKPVAKKAAPKKATAKKPVAKKPAAKKPAVKKAKTKRAPNPAFMKAMNISPALARIVGSKPLPRTEVVKKLWDYIKKNKLQDSGFPHESVGTLQTRITSKTEIEAGGGRFHFFR